MREGENHESNNDNQNDHNLRECYFRRNDASKREHCRIYPGGRDSHVASR